jgi:hypothetical protein
MLAGPLEEVKQDQRRSVDIWISLSKPQVEHNYSQEWLLRLRENIGIGSEKGQNDLMLIWITYRKICQFSSYARSRKIRSSREGGARKSYVSTNYELSDLGIYDRKQKGESAARGVNLVLRVLSKI